MSGGNTVVSGRDLSRAATLAEAAGAMRADLTGDGPRSYARPNTDSRTAAAGDLFFCLKGPTFDGHDFALATAGAGAAGVVCERARATAIRDALAAAGLGAAVLAVDDTQRALGDLATWYRRGLAGPVVGVTGSNGKTTTKEMIRAILLAGFGEGHVLATQGNLNNLIGVPLTLFRAEPAHRAAVIEMGMNAPGEIARLAEIAEPTVGLITCVGEAHLEGLGSIENIAKAKGELFGGLRPGAVAIVNADDPRVVGQASRFAGRHVTFGTGGDVRAEDVRCVHLDASSFDVVHEGSREHVELPLGGRHNVQNALGAVAAGLAAGVSLADAARGLCAMTPPPMRLAVERLPNGVLLINDAYNANPSSVAASLATLGSLDSRPVVVLGDMRELGPSAPDLHRRVGRQAAAISPALLCAWGEHAGHVAEGAREGGLDAARVVVCARHEDAADAVARAWLPGDAVLVKGSRGSAMEKVAEALRTIAGAEGPAAGAH